MSQKKKGLYETQATIGQIAEHVTQKTAKGEKPHQSQVARKNVLQHNQYEEDARATREQILIATGRARDAQGVHFHIWADTPKTRQIVTYLNTYVLGLERAREVVGNKPKHRRELKAQFFDTAQALINEVLNETGLDYINILGDWQRCDLPFETCPNVPR
jgi:hypothetical protein